MTSQPEGPFRLVIPSHASHVSTARLFISSLGRTLGLHPETIEDLRLAVSEAVTAVVLAGQVETVTLSGQIDAGGVTVRIEPLAQPVADAKHSDVYAFEFDSIVRALFAEAFFDDQGLVIPVSWRPPT